MTAPFTIRAAGLLDDGPLADLDRRTWSPTHAVSPPPQPPYGPFFDVTHPPGQFLVAELREDGDGGPAGGAGDGGRGMPHKGVVGYLRLVPPTSLPAHAHVRQIQGLAVDERVRGRGIARALLDAACDRAREEGAVRLTLRVLGHNAAARRLYETAGFMVEGVLPGEFRLEGAYVDDILMGRRLIP